MATTTKRNAPGGSKVFPIAITIAVLAMIGVLVITITSSKEEVKAQSKIEYSEAPSVSAISIDGKLGESKLPAFDSAASEDPAVGKIVPEIRAQDFSAKDVTLTPGKKPYVLAVLAHWCPHCRVEVPAIVKLHDEGALPDDVDFIAIASGTSDQKPNYPPSKWLLSEDWPWQKVADDQNGTIAQALGLTGYPYLIFVNADGTVSSRMSGEQSDPNIYVTKAEAISELKKK
mgnify:CR=1 FL=1